MAKKMAKSRRPDAERACEWYLRMKCGCVQTVRSIRTQWQRQDMFASDCIGKKTDGKMVFAQVTAGRNEALRVRRRKLEKIPWQATDIVMVLQLTETPNPVNNTRKQFWFRVHVYEHKSDGAGIWEVMESACPVPRLWFSAYKPEKDPRMHDDSVSDGDGVML